ncbi:hypothetical protein RJ45_05645 [Photobacterium gaetbulicola]|uniref:Protein kinase domain-containing protein n=1 Tax=Photobacterium gaetbulicola TaxID=1295392 RepID=A0A0B9G7J4_9GAMM|nr:hypothetical protein [Photobacterium gaetbulicola]KHT64574.1 hypothetical protein RJ45_05645 [Photobacterium gaetbulicola]
MTYVYDFNRIPQPLAKTIKSGGEGTVSGLVNLPHLVVKTYHRELKDQMGFRGDKLDAQIKFYHKHKAALDALPVAWPRLGIYDRDRKKIGYVMAKCEGLPLSIFRNPRLVNKYFPDLTRTELIGYILNLLDTASNLHLLGVYMGDINPDNFLIDPATGVVNFIDCDSYQLMYQGKHYPCTVGQASMLPREHINRNLAGVVRTEQSDTFSLMVVSFMMLMTGRHPYDHVDGSTTVDNILGGHFPYGQPIAPGEEGAVPPGNWYIWWDQLPYRLKGVFMKTFGATHPDDRDSITLLKEQLEYYRQVLIDGDKGYSNELWPQERRVRQY